MAGIDVSPQAGGYAVSGDLDMSSADRFEAFLKDALEPGAPVILDMRDVSFMDSTGIRVLIRALRDNPGGCLVLHAVRDEVWRVLEITRLCDMLPNLHAIPCSA